MDPSRGDPALPPGHPFVNVQSSDYWSATTFADDTSNAHFVEFLNGDVLFGNKDNINFVWCVRGGQGVDGVQ